MKYSYFFSKLIYNLFQDWKVQYIEDILSCEVMNGKGIYYPKFISYLVKSSIDETKIEKLEATIKKHIEIKYDNFNYIIKVYHDQLPLICNYEFHETKDIILGKTYDGLARIKINNEFNNAIIVGASGSGKSCLAQVIIKNLIDNNVECWICDNKGSWDYQQFNTDIGLNIRDFKNMLNRFEDEVERRLKENKKHKPLMFFIDEIFPISCLETKQRKAIMNQLSLVMSRCRSANAHICLITQRCTTDIIDSRIMANISNRICLQTSSKQESINVLSDDKAFFINIVGRGILSINGKQTEFQSFYLGGESYDN